jgi:hypothetical protein
MSGMFLVLTETRSNHKAPHTTGSVHEYSILGNHVWKTDRVHSGAIMVVMAQDDSSNVKVGPYSINQKLINN